MGIKYFVFAVNKMDLAGYAKEPFERICTHIGELKNNLGLQNVKIIPLSATEGENVTRKSELMGWYDGESLLDYLETVEIDTVSREEGFYLPVQRVCRPDHTFRGFQGQIEAGELREGDELTSLPSGTQAAVKAIYVGEDRVAHAVRGQAVTVELDREIDVSRGSVLAKGTALHIVSRFDATLLWMDDDRFINSRSMFVKAGTRLIPGKITGIRYIIDVNTGEHRNARSLQKNELALCSVELSSPAVLDTFTNHRTLGELILIDRVTNATSACGVIETIIDSHDQRETEVSPEVRAKYLGQTPFLILASDVRKAEEIEMKLLSQGMHTMRLCVSGERLIFAADILQRAGLITVISGDYLDRETEAGLRKKLYSDFILDLRESVPEKDRLLYENMVNYVFL